MKEGMLKRWMRDLKSLSGLGPQATARELHLSGCDCQWKSRISVALLSSGGTRRHVVLDDQLARGKGGSQGDCWRPELEEVVMEPHVWNTGVRLHQHGGIDVGQEHDIIMAPGAA